MDPHYVENTWTLLKNAINEIHRKNASGLSFEELYRNAYNMVLHKYGDKLYNNLKAVVDEHLKKVAEGVAEANEEKFLNTLCEAWAEHTQSMLMIRDILMYMDRVYVVNNNVNSVYDLGLILFKENVARHLRIRPRLLSMILDAIKSERTGEVINRAIIKNITQMLVELGLNSRSVYEEDFEKAFLDTSSSFYKVESQTFISSNSASDYMKKVEGRLKEEMERVNHYLDSATEPKIKEVLERELISTHMKALVEMEGSGLVSMLKDDKIEDLTRMYHLLQRVSKGHDLMRQVMSDFVRETGKQIVENPETQNKENTYVQHLLDLKEKYDNILSKAMGNDKNFQHTLNQAFEYFINLNPRSPEYISLFIDDKLRKGLKGVSDEEMEQTLDKVMMLFRFIQEKDIFEKYYKQHLARRLLLGRSASDDAERNMISKLKTECGYQFTSKLEGMFQDMKQSATSIEGFKSFLSSLEPNPIKGMELNVQVLTTGFWPTQNAAKCNMPPEIVKCCDVFQKYYNTLHSGRRLTWQTTMGTGELRAFFGSKRHELNVSTHQMVLLLLFNNHDTLSFKDMLNATGIPGPDLHKNLLPLLVPQHKILTKNPPTKKFAPTDEFSFNEGFKSKLFRVKVLQVLQKESEPERGETQKKVDEDRKHMIEAAIVRTMKARKTMQHANLVAEVTKQLSTRFRPSPVIIKKRIESLIEREYLERSGTDRKVYNYLA
uniref:Cullin family profile domain-containing protein n=1 Tax=Arcella intermedia TaxID=1963864 RepID=A0A6B2KYR3_9EUKA